MRIALTGSIACGKSTIAKLLGHLGAHIIDADKIAHQALKKNEKTYFKIIEIFGKDVLDEEGNIDRKKLGSIVFEDKEKLKALELIIHPFVQSQRKEIEDDILDKDKKAIIIYDVPLLFEKHLESDFDKIIVVYLDKKTQIKRLMKRENISCKEALRLISLQMDIKEKVKRADFVIDNSHSLEDTKKQVLDLWQHIYLS